MGRKKTERNFEAERALEGNTFTECAWGWLVDSDRRFGRVRDGMGSKDREGHLRDRGELVDLVQLLPPEWL